jgi:hypothetical protein
VINMKEKKRTYNDLNHIYGRIFLAVAIIIIVMIPVTIALVLKVSPDFGVIATCMLSLIVFIAGGFVEVITYSPMLGTAGTYLGFFTGNLVNLKVPCVVNARELAGVKHGSKEGEIVSTISVATSTIVTTLVIAYIPQTSSLELTFAKALSISSKEGAMITRYSRLGAFGVTTKVALSLTACSIKLIQVPVLESLTCHK